MVTAMEDTGDIPSGPVWHAIQPPKLRKFTREESEHEADDFVREAEQITVNYKMEQGATVEWLLLALAGCARRELSRWPQRLKETFGDQWGLSAL